MLELDLIRVDGGTQARAARNDDAVSEYAEAYRSGASMPAVIVFYDGSNYWLADGFHRYYGAKQAGLTQIYEEVRPGTQRDAVLFSVGANATHGLRRSDADKRRAVMFLLADEEWGMWSDREIARRCCVSPTTVSRVRADVAAFYKGEARGEGGKYRPGRDVVFDSYHLLKIPTVHVDSDERTYATKHGTVATMETANIGKTFEQNVANIGKSAAQAPPLPAAAPKITPAHEAPPPATKVTPAPVAPKPENPYAPDKINGVEHLTEQLIELSESLKSTLADNEMMGRVFDADDRIKAAMDEAKRQKAIADNAERTLAAKKGEYIARAEQVIYWKNRAEKAEKALAKAVA